MPLPVAVVIPAYRPGPALAALAGELARMPFAGVVVVDDGSDQPTAEIPSAVVLRHAVNLGKGAALKTGINHAATRWPEIAGVVTADADGQHLAADILGVAERLAREPECLVLGARDFGPGVPPRNLAGNKLSNLAVRLLIGQRLTDTQTGLRGIPRSLFPQLLRMPSSGYEFELDMLIAARHSRCRIVEQPIRAVYVPGNASHFDPLLDSMRISVVLARFSFVALATAAIDNVVFWIAFNGLGTVGRAQVIGRAVAVIFNYSAARRAVFLAADPHRATLPKYLLLVTASGLASYALIQWLSGTFGVLGAKLLAESALFFANFALQRDFIFRRRRPE